MTPDATIFKALIKELDASIADTRKRQMRIFVENSIKAHHMTAERLLDVWMTFEMSQAARDVIFKIAEFHHGAKQTAEKILEGMG